MSETELTPRQIRALQLAAARHTISKMDANVLLGIVAIVIQIILVGVSTWYASVLTNRQIRATLQAANPVENTKPVRKRRRRVGGPKRRHALKARRVIRHPIVASFVGSISATTEAHEEGGVMRQSQKGKNISYRTLCACARTSARPRRSPSCAPPPSGPRTARTAP